MKLNQLALAVASLTAVSAANAAITIDDTTVRLWLSGASAPTASVYQGFLTLCQGMTYKNAAGDVVTNPGTLDAAVYLRGATNTAPGGSGNEEMAYSCTIDTDDDRAGSLEGVKTVVYHGVANGSFMAYAPHLKVAGDTNANLPATYERLANLESNACNSGSGTSTNVTVSGQVNAIERFNSCAVTAYGFTTGQDYREDTDADLDMDQYDNPIVPDGGYSDTEYAINKANMEIATDLGAIGAEKGTKVGQAFGVGVSYKLYRQLQKNDFGATNSCYTGGTDAAPVLTGACQPNLSRATYSTVANFANRGGINGKVFGGLATDTVTLARRVNTSGTQSTSNLNMLNKPCATNPELGGAFVPVSAGDPGLASTFTVINGSSTGSVRTALHNASTAGTFALGYLSMENTPSGGGTDGKYAFVKMDGVSPNFLPDGSADSKQRQNAMKGLYPQWVELVSFINNVDPAGISEDDDLIAAIDASLSNPFITDLKGLFISKSLGTNANESPLFRDKASCQPVQKRF